jgi:hypothetical protein
MLVMGKDGEDPRLYAGSATRVFRFNQPGGFRGRWNDYDDGIMIPNKVKATMEDGLKVTSKIAICALPEANGKELSTHRVLSPFLKQCSPASSGK